MDWFDVVIWIMLAIGLLGGIPRIVRMIKKEEGGE